MKFNQLTFLLLLFFSSASVLLSCNFQQEEKPRPSVNEIMNADISFSEMSRQVGMKKAFLEYIDKEGALLRPGYLPIVGANAVDFLSQLNDTSYTLTWTPMHADISRSGDLGYTYGVYKLETEDTTYKGTYVNIWKRENDGSWKFVLDMGNEGIHGPGSEDLPNP